MKFRIRHVTEYSYSSSVSSCYNRAHLLPRETHNQFVNAPRVVIFPTPASGNRRIDYFGNRVYHFSVTEAHQNLSIAVTTEVTLKDSGDEFSSRLDYGNSCADVWKNLNDSHAAIETLYAREFVLNSPMVKATQELAEFASPCFEDNKPFHKAVSDLSHKIFSEFEFDPASTTVATPLDELLALRRGVCQDFAHLAIGCLRSLGYAARYISGYLETLPPPGQVKLRGADASHAWFAAYSPGEGWLEFDPTNDSVPSFQHIVTAWGRDYSDVSPLRGVITGGGQSQSLKVSVDVERLEY